MQYFWRYSSLKSAKNGHFRVFFAFFLLSPGLPGQKRWHPKTSILALFKEPYLSNPYRCVHVLWTRTRYVLPLLGTVSFFPIGRLVRVLRPTPRAHFTRNYTFQRTVAREPCDIFYDDTFPARTYPQGQHACQV